MRLFHPSRLMYSALLLAPGLIAQPKLPETGTEVRSLFPPGAQKGTTVEILFRGRRLEDVSVIQFLHPGIQTEVCHAEAYELVAIVSIGK